MIDERELERILTSKAELNRRVFEFPTSQILLNGRKSSYYKAINSCQFEECNQALTYVVSRLQTKDICALIDEIEWFSDVRKRFLKRMVDLRYDMIIMASYEKLR